jgi:hypothetical protein
MLIHTGCIQCASQECRIVGTRQGLFSSNRVLLVWRRSADIMTAMRLRYFIAVIVGLFFIAVALLLWAGRQPGPSAVRVTFIGTTNDLRGTLLYCFRATNTAERELTVSYQTLVPFPFGTGEGPAMSQRALFVSDAKMPARSSREFTFPAPEETSSTWRVLLFYDYPQPAWRSRLNGLANAVGVSRRVVNDVAEQKTYSEIIPKR